MDGSDHGALVVVGSGPGVGSHIAARFAREGFQKIILMSRNEARLKVDAAIIRTAAPNTDIDTVPVDLTMTVSVRRALIEVERRLDGMRLECIVFNAARVATSELLSWPVEELQRDLHITVVSLYTVAQWAFPQLQELVGYEQYKPSLLVTSGSICQDPFPELFSLSACKAAQYNLVTSFYREYGPKGIHCGLVVVGGRLKEHFLHCNATEIAAKTWDLYDQGKDAWKLEITLMHPDDAPSSERIEPHEQEICKVDDF